MLSWHTAALISCLFFIVPWVNVKYVEKTKLKSFWSMHLFLWINTSLFNFHECGNNFMNKYICRCVFCFVLFHAFCFRKMCFKLQEDWGYRTFCNQIFNKTHILQTNQKSSKNKCSYMIFWWDFTMLNLQQAGVIFFFIFKRLAPSLKWSPGPTESYSGVSILPSDPIVALIGQSNGKPNDLLHYHHANTCASIGWTNELQSCQCLWQSTSPDFGKTGSDFPWKVWGILHVINLGIEFH